MSLILFNQNNLLKIDGTYITDLFHVSGFPSMPNVLVKDIIYPKTKGRKVMQLGAEHTDETSMSCQFSPEPPSHDNMLYADDYNELWDRLVTITELIQANITHTILCPYFTLANVRVQFSLNGKAGIRGKQGHQLVCQDFTLTAYQYRA
jgi:hypothetical protein